MFFRAFRESKKTFFLVSGLGPGLQGRNELLPPQSAVWVARVHIDHFNMPYLLHQRRAGEGWRRQREGLGVSEWVNNVEKDGLWKILIILLRVGGNFFRGFLEKGYVLLCIFTQDLKFVQTSNVYSHVGSRGENMGQEDLPSPHPPPPLLTPSTLTLTISLSILSLSNSVSVTFQFVSW